MAKFVDVVKEVVVTYRVDGAPTDKEAVEIVKKRLEVDAPLDIIAESTKVKSFVVKDSHEPAKG
jgi:hypothetical protein